MVLARKKRVAAIIFQVSHLRANETMTETNIPDYVGHCEICFDARPGHGTVLQYPMKRKHCRHKWPLN